MNKKIIKSVLLTTGLTLGLSMSVSAEAHAATYTAVKGDSLYTISREFNTTVANLMVANDLSNYDLNIGQNLNVPCEKYIVQKGDTLYKISQKYNISLFNLRRANNVYTNYIFVGQVLEIPLPLTEQKNETTTETKNDLPNVNETSPSQTEPVTSEPVPTVTEPVAQTPVPAPKEETPVVAYTAEELDLLARLIMAETESQPYQAKVAVGAVVINRIKSGLFAPTISGVINQTINGYYQFSPVQNGWIKRAASEECFKAAKEALSGVDNTDGSLFYYDTSTTNQWILSKPVAVTYGDMVYAY
jgi:spore germination cell wall hydrolase CwlJ-like protein